MLILPNHLTDKNLNFAEASAKYKAEKDKQLDQYRLPDQQLLTDLVARMGKPMTHTDMVERIRKITGYKLWAEESITMPGNMNLYRMVKDVKTCCNTPFRMGYVPEYTVIHETDRRMPGERTPGWREVLLRLIKQRIITRPQADGMFGPPTPTNTTLWQQFVRDYA